MRQKLHLKTISPVHIGSGDELMPGTEYVTFREHGKIAVIDPKKIPAIIGEDNIQQWISVIDQNGDLLKDLLKVRKPDISPEDIASRAIQTVRLAPEKEKIKAQLHLGIPYSPAIPGSSLKGSIRTAILNTLIKQNSDFAGNERNLGRERNGQIQFSDRDLQAHYLAPPSGTRHRPDAQNDLLRLLHVGDVLLKTNTELHKTMVVNQYKNGWDEKKSLSSYYECIPASVEASFNMTVPDDLLKQIQHKRTLKIPTDFPAYNFKKLFKLINKHSLFLLNDEIEFWTEEDNPMALDEYLDHMEAIKKIAQSCAENECVLRVGAGSGWDYMTGAWPRSKDDYGDYIMKDNTWRKLKNSLRRGHYSEEVPYPKTRKLIKGGVPFGFVKVSMV